MEGPQAPAHGPMGSSQGSTFCFRPWFLESFLPFPRMTYSVCRLGRKGSGPPRARDRSSVGESIDRRVSSSREQVSARPVAISARPIPFIVPSGRLGRPRRADPLGFPTPRLAMTRPPWASPRLSR